MFLLFVDVFLNNVSLFLFFSSFKVFIRIVLLIFLSFEKKENILVFILYKINNKIIFILFKVNKIK